MIAKCPNCGGALEYDVISDRMNCSHCMSSFMVGELQMAEERKEAEVINNQNYNVYGNEYYAPPQNQYYGQAINQDNQSAYYYNQKPDTNDYVQDNLYYYKNQSYNQETYVNPFRTDMSDSWSRKASTHEYNENADELMECNIYTCTACGAELMINGVESSTYCAYCSQPTIVFDRVSMQRKPKLIIPFSISKDQAMNIIRERLNRGAFIPEEMKHFKVDTLRGIYVPYWLVDVEYRDSMLIKGTVSRGKNTTIKHYYRRAEARFKRIPVDASKRFNDMSSTRLEPFDYNYRREFNPQYLSGFYSDCSDEEASMVDYKASLRAKEVFEDKIIESVNASSKKIVANKPQFKVNAKTYMMIPVWFMIFKYLGKDYTIMVNGQTGKLVGAVPTQKHKVVLFFSVFAAVFSILLFFLINALIFTGDGFSEGQENMMFYCLFGAGICYANAFKKFKKYKKSIELTEENEIRHFVKDRQEGM